MRSGLAALAEHAPIIDGCVLEGVEDAVNLFEAEVDALNRGRATSALKRELGSLRTHLARRPATLLEWRRLLTQLEERLQAVSILFHDLEDLQRFSARQLRVPGDDRIEQLTVIRERSPREILPVERMVPEALERLAHLCQQLP